MNWQAIQLSLGLSALLGLTGCEEPAPELVAAGDLAIINASVLDVRTGEVLPNRSVIVRGGVISAVKNTTESLGPQVIDARGRLLTPGFVDAHLHLCNVYFPPACTSPRDGQLRLTMNARALAGYRRDLGALYLPYGVTTVRDAGSDERFLPLLREPAFQGGLIEAEKLGMHVTGHVDYNVVTVERALELGLRNFEHVLPWVLSSLNQRDVNDIYEDVGRRTNARSRAGFFYLAVPEQWNRVGPNDERVLQLIDKLAAAKASVTPTLHIFAQRLGLTWFTSPARDPNEDASGFSASDRARGIAGYRVMASYVKTAYDAGVQLNIGTDTPEPGKSVLSEMLLLHDAGIPMSQVFRIATLDSAHGIGRGAEYGSIEPGKRANLVLFEGNPLREPRDLLGGKTVIKDGVVYNPPVR
ncbi:MAG TPA: amidohydrolase family protein [Gemmatimonadaceae bacterium]|nr:amidohydrolase family protein [Gemmatimonadaceae bacterium]